MQEETLEDLVAYRDSLIKLQRFGDVLNRLEQNQDFKEIILDGFCTSYCCDCITAYADPHLQAQLRDRALEASKSTGYLKAYLNTIKVKALEAERDIPEYNKMIEEKEFNSSGSSEE